MGFDKAVGIPGRYAPRQCAFNEASVEVGEGPYGHTKFPEPPEEEEALTVASTWEVQDRSSVTITPRNLMLFTLSKLSSIDVDGGVFSFLSCFPFVLGFDGQEEEILGSGTGNTFELVGVKRNESGVYGCRVLDFDADDTDFNANKTITIN
eukprot:g32725.t1